MPEPAFKYVIIGSGLAGTSAIEGIRELDQKGAILLIGSEKHLPYDRPPLTKKLWSGKKKVEDIFLHKQNYYDQQAVTLALGATATSLDIRNRSVADNMGKTYRFEKLLLATGGTPRVLQVPGGDLEGIYYFRNLNHYLDLKAEASPGRTALIVGGGFIGSELAASLAGNNVKVTMVFPDPYLASRVFPKTLGHAIQKTFTDRGVNVLTGQKPLSFTKKGQRFVTRIENGSEIESDIVIAGIGIAPVLDLARTAGLQTANGVIVNEHLEASLPGIYAAGDNAFFHYTALNKQARVEHWDNALNQGKLAGRNMAGAREKYTYMPYFFSDLFEFGYEAVGEVTTRFETYADWQKENETGVIYYLDGGRVKGAVMCNIWDKVDAARDLILKGEQMTKQSLRGAIR